MDNVNSIYLILNLLLLWNYIWFFIFPGVSKDLFYCFWNLNFITPVFSYFSKLWRGRAQRKGISSPPCITTPPTNYSYHLFFVFLFFRAAPAACGGSQARGRIGAVAAGYTTATTMPDPSHICDLHCSSRHHRILNRLSEARDRTCVLKDAGQICFYWATMGTPLPPLLASSSTLITAEALNREY